MFNRWLIFNKHLQQYTYIKSLWWLTSFSKEELEAFSYKKGGLWRKGGGLKGGRWGKDGGLAERLLTLDMSELMVNYCYWNKYNFFYFIYASYR